MSKQIGNNLFTASSLARLLYGIERYEQLGKQIVLKIKQAHSFRQVETVRDLSKVLSGFPIREYHLIGQYYLIWCEGRKQKLHTDLLEKIAEQSESHKSIALISRAGFEGLKSNIESELYFYKEAIKASSSVSEYLDSARAIAVVKSKEGFHKSALEGLEDLIPLIRHAEPLKYYDFLNSYAVELAENNRLSEAHNVSSLAVGSPFGPYYKEWQDTFPEVSQKRNKTRSRVSIIKNIERESEPQTPPANAAKVLPFRPQAPVEAEGFSPFHTLEPKSEFNKVFKFDTRELEATICNWMNGDISPEEFASVLSSIRNLKDPARIKDILDRMIHYAFLQTSQAREAEQAWRNSLYVEIPPDDKD